jgi:hypothetical protein
VTATEGLGDQKDLLVKAGSLLGASPLNLTSNQHTDGPSASASSTVSIDLDLGHVGISGKVSIPMRSLKVGPVSRRQSTDKEDHDKLVVLLSAPLHLSEESGTASDRLSKGVFLKQQFSRCELLLFSRPR